MICARPSVAARMHSANIYMAVVGTLGDVLPFIALGENLARRGSSVTLLSNSDYAALAGRHGLEFAAVAPPNPPQSDYTRTRAFARIFIPAFEEIFNRIALRVRDREPLLVITHDLCLGALFACERFALRCVKVILSPAGLLAAEEAGPQADEPSDEEAAELLCVNEFRRKVGLQEVRRAAEGGPGQIPLVLCMFPDSFRMAASVLPANTRVVGFPFARFRIKPMDQELEDFIAREGRPLVFTPGTGMYEVGEFFEIAAHAAKRLRNPAVFLSAHIQRNRYARHERIAIREFVDLSEILPRAALIVHHGGIGTVAAAVRAAIPQIVSPLLFDQPANAARVKSLSLGDNMPRTSLTSSSLEESICRLLHDETLFKHLKTISEEVGRFDAIDASTEAIESTFQDLR